MEQQGRGESFHATSEPRSLRHFAWSLERISLVRKICGQFLLLYESVNLPPCITEFRVCVCVLLVFCSVVPVIFARWLVWCCVVRCCVSDGNPSAFVTFSFVPIIEQIDCLLIGYCNVFACYRQYPDCHSRVQRCQFYCWTVQLVCSCIENRVCALSLSLFFSGRQ